MGITGDGLGNAITLATKAPEEPGLGLHTFTGHRLVTTFDELPAPEPRRAVEFVDTRVGDYLGRTTATTFLKTSCGRKRAGIDNYYPLQRNHNGAFRSIHVMGDLSHHTRRRPAVAGGISTAGFAPRAGPC